MPASEIRIDPPDLGATEAFAQFPPDDDLVQSEYRAFAFYDLNWQERHRPGIRFDTVLFKNAVLSKTKLRSVILGDVRVISCDLAGADWTGAHFSRVEILSSRITGFVGSEGHYEHVVFRGCKAAYAVFQMAKLSRCRFEKCDLAHATFEEATVRQVVFKDCNLTNARFVRSRLSGVDLRGSRIDGLEINLEEVRGLRIDLLQAPVIAALAGAVIEEVEETPWPAKP